MWLVRSGHGEPTSNAVLTVDGVRFGAVTYSATWTLAVGIDPDGNPTTPPIQFRQAPGRCWAVHLVCIRTLREDGTGTHLGPGNHPGQATSHQMHTTIHGHPLPQDPDTASLSAGPAWDDLDDTATAPIEHKLRDLFDAAVAPVETHLAEMLYPRGDLREVDRLHARLHEIDEILDSLDATNANSTRPYTAATLEQAPGLNGDVLLRERHQVTQRLGTLLDQLT